MKKKILGATFVVAMAAIAGYNTYVNQTKVEMSDMALANVEALADGNMYDESQNAIWSINTENCTHTTTVGADGTVNIFGIVKVVDLEAGASYSETWEDVRTDCSTGGNSLCTPYTCANFFLEITKISMSNKS